MVGRAAEALATVRYSMSQTPAHETTKAPKECMQVVCRWMQRIQRKQHKHARSGEVGEGEGEPTGKANQTCRKWTRHITGRSIDADDGHARDKPQPVDLRREMKPIERRQSQQDVEVGFRVAVFRCSLRAAWSVGCISLDRMAVLCISINFQISPEFWRSNLF